MSLSELESVVKSLSSSVDGEGFRMGNGRNFLAHFCSISDRRGESHKEEEAFYEIVAAQWDHGRSSYMGRCLQLSGLSTVPKVKI